MWTAAHVGSAVTSTTAGCGTVPAKRAVPLIDPSVCGSSGTAKPATIGGVDGSRSHPIASATTMRMTPIAFDCWATSGNLRPGNRVSSTGMRVETTMNGRRVAGVVSVAVLLAVAVGCEQGEREQRAATPLDLTTVGSIAGEVRFDGTPPTSATVQLASAKDCAAQHRGPIVADDVLVRDGKVQNALVYVKEGLGDRVFAAPREPVVVDQKGCMLAP